MKIEQENLLFRTRVPNQKIHQSIFFWYLNNDSNERNMITHQIIIRNTKVTESRTLSEFYKFTHNNMNKRTNRKNIA